MTNQHVVEDASQVRVNTGNEIKAARMVRVDKANDLALLKVDGAFPALPIASSLTMALGNPVATVGFPNIELMGFSPKLAKRLPPIALREGRSLQGGRAACPKF